MSTGNVPGELEILGSLGRAGSIPALGRIVCIAGTADGSRPTALGTSIRPTSVGAPPRPIVSESLNSGGGLLSSTVLDPRFVNPR